MTQAAVQTESTPSSLLWTRVAGTLLLAAAMSALFYYKCGASLRAYAIVQETGKLAVNPDVLLHARPWAATLAYFSKIWPALTYGIVIGAIVRAAVSPSWIVRTLGARGFKGSLTGGLLGTPLMLCSCCVTPIFTGLYERGARLSSSLAVMLAAPGFNVAALVLTFALLPAKIAVARLLCAFAIVLGLPTLLGRLEGTIPRTKASCAVEPAEPTTVLEFGRRFLRSLGYLVAITVPLIVVGVVLGGLALPYVTRLTQVGATLGLVLVSLVSVLVALPTFFEIAIALVMLRLGASEGAALAVVVAGPIVNLPSLFVVGRETSPRLALRLGLGVWAVASFAGIVV